MSGFIRCAGILLATVVFGSASAAQFQLSPVRVQLEARQRADTVVVSNNGDEPLRFEVSVHRWSMGSDGTWHQEPSDDLVVHPLLLEVAARDKSRLRVGVLEPPLAGPERAYRIELQELPSDTTASSSQLKMLTRISLPVFVEATAGKPRAALAGARLEPTALAFELRNDGDHYLPPQSLGLELRSAGAEVLDRQELQGGYVLAGANFPVKARVPAGLCSQVAAIAVVLGETSERLELTLPASARRCAP